MQQLKNNLNDGTHSLIVPDRFALFHEKAVFEALEATSLFNVEVLSFSRLTKKILGASGSVNKISGTMIIKKLLDENRIRFKCFTKSLFNSGFAGEVYATIEQLKSCDILPETILKAAGGQDYLSKKMSDLALIYESYNKYLLSNNLYDSGDEFNRLIEVGFDNDYFKNRHIYICAFDSFTRQTYRIIEKLIRQCKSVSIVLYMDENNKNIYPADTYQNIINMAKNIGVEANIISASNVLSGQFKHLGDNLFKFKPAVQKITDSQIFLSEYRDILSEITKAAQIIRKGVVKDNLRYKDFAVAISNLEVNRLMVSKVFDEFGISCFLDTSTPLSDTVLMQFVNKCLDTVRFGFGRSELMSLVKNNLSGISFSDACDFEEILTKYNFERQMFKKEIMTPEKEYAVYNQVRKNILKGLKPLSIKSGSTAEFSEALKQVMGSFKVQQQLDELSDKYNEQGLLKQQQQNGQLLGKLGEILDSMTKVLGDSKITLDEFADILNSGCSACNVSSVPISLDSVFVGDSSNSFFENTHTLFILSANAGDMPKTLQDCGIILDREIDILKDKYNIEPSIKTINLRERFKLYNLCLSPQKRLFVSFHTKGANTKEVFSPFVGQIRDMFLCEVKGEYQPLQIAAAGGFNFVEEASNVTLAVTKLSGVLRKIYDGGNVINQREYATLLSCLKDRNTYFKNYQQLLDYKNFHKLSVSVLTDTDNISASGVETFYTCPFLYFIKYGLRIREKLSEQFDAMTIGNIMHKFAEKLHKEITLPADDKMVKEVSEKVIGQVLGEYNLLLQFPGSKVPVQGLRKEAVRLGTALNFQAKNSDFKTLHTEVRFGVGGTLEGIKITVGNKTLVISGQIDRIDALGDFFRVIDYKTGSAETSLSELYFGKKIQLYLYQAVLNKKYKPAGGYYLPIKNKPAEKGKSQQWIYRLKGYTLFDHNIIMSSDKGLKEGASSEIIEVRRNSDKNGEATFHSAHSKLLTHDQLVAFADLVLEMTKKAAENILSGNLVPSPLVLSKSPCEYCAYVGICRFDQSFGNIKREPKQKIDEDFVCASIKGGECND